jgi:hypothetical protein
MKLATPTGRASGRCGLVFGVEFKYHRASRGRILYAFYPQNYNILTASMYRPFFHMAATEIDNFLHISDEIAVNVKCVLIQ